jgi:MarR family transcriptional regulator, 2-MHQ and catechol-resistance regulon repressor
MTCIFLYMAKANSRMEGADMEMMEKSLANLFYLTPVFNDLFMKPFETTRLHESLNKSHIRTLIFLRLEGKQSMTRLAARVELEKGSFTPVARYLINSGLVNKLPEPGDKRLGILTLTAKGKGVVDEIIGKYKAFLDIQLDKLSRTERDSLMKSIECLISLGDKLYADEKRVVPRLSMPQAMKA